MLILEKIRLVLFVMKIGYKLLLLIGNVCIFLSVLVISIFLLFSIKKECYGYSQSNPLLGIELSSCVLLSKFKNYKIVNKQNIY